MVTVLFMKWGRAYTAAYVNIIYTCGVGNLAQPFRFVCVANDDNGYRETWGLLPTISL